MADDVNERCPETEEEEVTVRTEVQAEVPPPPPPPEEHVPEPMEPMERAPEPREPLPQEWIPEQMEPPRVRCQESTPEMVASHLRERAAMTGSGNGPMFAPRRVSLLRAGSGF
jgi:hypothetical protein